MLEKIWTCVPAYGKLGASGLNKGRETEVAQGGLLVVLCAATA